ncbi:hypothetical protein B0H13DRAFT_1853865 [Mycena leptocephala]|nr:hypothetical protein B0H13DRAFT_1853865 [Mycena leptocephala]
MCIKFKKIVLQYQAHSPILARSTRRLARIGGGNSLWLFFYYLSSAAIAVHKHVAGSAPRFRPTKRNYHITSQNWLIQTEMSGTQERTSSKHCERFMRSGKGQPGLERKSHYLADYIIDIAKNLVTERERDMAIKV